MNDLKYAGYEDTIHSMQLISERRWNLLLKNGIILKLPAEKPINALVKTMPYIRKINRKIDYVDLRLIPEKIFIKYIE